MNASNATETHPEQSAQQVIEKVKTLASERCHSACDRTKEMIKKNPVPTVLGALVFGAAVGYLVLSRRESIADRLVRESHSARRRFSEVPGRFSSLLHDGYDVASRGADKASSFFHDLPTDEVADTLTKSINRLCNRIKFW